MGAVLRTLVGASLCLLLVACQEDGPEIMTGGDFGESLMAERKAACEADGGRWGAGAAGGAFVCYTPMRDAGKPCSRGTDCDGLCLARSRTCAPVDPFIGCHETLTNSGLPATVCLE